MTGKKVIERVIYPETILTKGEYESLTFLNCSFYNADLSGFVFNDCDFDACDLSLAKITNAVFNDVRFSNSKLLGLHFDECNDLLLSVGFNNCQLNLSSFYKLKLKKTEFKNCILKECDFTEADLSSSAFENCNLLQAIFYGTILEKADFRSSFNYSVDPEKNRIRKARFSRAGIAGLLDKYDIEIE